MDAEKLSEVEPRAQSRAEQRRAARDTAHTYLRCTGRAGDPRRFLLLLLLPGFQPSGEMLRF